MHDFGPGSRSWASGTRGTMNCGITAPKTRVSCCRSPVLRCS
jgi:hypothetical protein